MVDIADHYEIMQGEVPNTLKGNGHRGVPTSIPRPVRPRCTFRSDDRHLCRIVFDGRIKSANVLRAEWQELTNVWVYSAITLPARIPTCSCPSRQHELRWTNITTEIQLRWLWPASLKSKNVQACGH